VEKRPSSLILQNDAIESLNAWWRDPPARTRHRPYRGPGPFAAGNFNLWRILRKGSSVGIRWCLWKATRRCSKHSKTWGCAAFRQYRTASVQ